MTDTLVLGKRYRIFLTNHFKFEGTLLSNDARLIKILDDVSHTERILPWAGITNIEVLQ